MSEIKCIEPYPGIIVAISRNDDRFDVDEAWGLGTYDRLFPEPEGDDDGA